MNRDNPAFDYEDGTQKDGHFHETLMIIYKQ